MKLCTFRRNHDCLRQTQIHNMRCIHCILYSIDKEIVLLATTMEQCWQNAGIISRKCQTKDEPNFNDVAAPFVLHEHFFIFFCVASMTNTLAVHRCLVWS